jgi:A/G-specific adenine glycosylase
LHYTNKTKTILKWYDREKRLLPWRETLDPYKIWLSEVMLQQTQVNTVIPYFKKWLIHYPTIQSVAEAKLDDLLKLWEGLGYYSRCRNFYNGAKEVILKFDGIIPSSIEVFRKFPGVGEYISGAVMSIAFNQPYIAMDGNHRRVISRVLGIKNLSKHNLNRIKYSLTQLIGIERPGDVNQALMDIGSSICKSREALCLNCPMQSTCRAFLSGKPLSYPFKIKKKIKTTRQLAAALIEDRGSILIFKRPHKGLLGGLWELPNVVISNYESARKNLKDQMEKKYGYNIMVNQSLGKISHSFTHYKMNIRLYQCKTKKNKISEPSIKWVRYSDLDQYAFSKANHKLFELIEEKNV